MKQEVVMVCGFPASGKGTLSEGYTKQGYTHVNRDKAGGTVVSLVPVMEAELKAGRSVVLDNLFATAESRRPFIEMAKKHGVPIRCEMMGTSAEDASINALHRMWKRYDKVFLSPPDFKEVKNDPNMFPIVVIFKYKKDLEKPKTTEGFDTVKVVPFVRIRPADYTKKAILFDYDGTLRTTPEGSEFDFPTKKSEVILLPNRAKVLQGLDKAREFILLGVSNQSGIARGQVTEQSVEECFAETNLQLRVGIDYQYCPHNVPPNCYCRKPASGIGVYFIEKYHLDPRSCIFVGDQTTDATFAKRLDMQYVDASEFFK